jgi:hypothetical protein
MNSYNIGYKFQDTSYLSVLFIYFIYLFICHINYLCAWGYKQKKNQLKYEQIG